MAGVNMDAYARQVLKAGKDLGISPRGIVIAFATVFVESNWVMYANRADPPSLTFPHEALSYDANSVGLFQQRAEWWGTVEDRMDPYRSAVLFFRRLEAFDYNDRSHSPGYWAQRVQGSAFPARYDQHIDEAEALYYRLTRVGDVKAMEKILNYPRNAVGDYDGVVQQRSWDCGPASAQIILAACGVNKSEQFLIDRIGTTVDGTNHAGLICPILNELLPGSGYKAVWLSREPVPQEQVEQLWKDVVRSIDAGRGVVLNFEAPPRNFPRGSNGSSSPEYRGNNTIYHYVAGMGYAVDANGGRHIWIADPGFRPFGYFCTLEQVATLIVPHAYAFAATAVAPAATPVPAPAPAIKPVPIPTPAPTVPVNTPPVAPTTPSTAPGVPPIPDASDRLSEIWLEWNAVMYGDLTAVSSLVKAAQGGDPRSQSALNLLERVNPAALQAFIQSKGN